MYNLHVASKFDEGSNLKLNNKFQKKSSIINCL